MRAKAMQVTRYYDIMLVTKKNHLWMNDTANIE